MKLTIKDHNKVAKFSSIFQHLKQVVDCIAIHFSVDGMYIQGMDSTQICLFECKLTNDWFDEYEFTQNVDAPRVCVNTTILYKVISAIDEKHKIEDNLIKGCQSRVWLHADLSNDNIIFTADSDAIITKGIIALVIRVFSNHTPKEIAESELFFIDQIGLKEHLSPTRSNGLLAMVKQIKMYSLAFQAKAK